MGLRVYDPNQENEQEEQQQGGGAQGGSVQLSKGEPASAGVSGSLGQRPKSSSGNFTNIQKYRQANQQGAQGLAQGVSNKIGQVAQEGEQELQSQQNEFNTGVQNEQNRLTGLETGARDNVQNVVQGGANFDQGFKALEAGMNAAYQGPNQLRNMGLIQEQAKNVKQLGQATQNDAGRLALLNRFYNKPDYTSGQQRLDTLLLGGQAGQLKQARQKSQELGVKLPGVTQDVNKQVQSFVDPETGIVKQVQGNVRDIALNATDQRLARQAKEVQTFIDTEKARRENEAKKLKAQSGTFNNINVTATPSQGSYYLDPSHRGDGIISNISYNLDPATLRALGVYNYQTDLDLDKRYNDQELRGLIGRLDEPQVADTQRLQRLLELAEIEKQQDLTQGKWLTDNNLLNKVKSEYSKAAGSSKLALGVDDLQDMISGKKPNTYNGGIMMIDSKTGKPVTAAQDELTIRKQLEQEALANTLKKYGINPGVYSLV